MGSDVAIGAGVEVRAGREAGPVRALTLMGQRMDAVTAPEVIALMLGARASRRVVLIANHNLHSLALVRTSAAMQAFYARADVVEIDSTPLIHLARLLGHEVGAEHRCTYLDWRDAFFEQAAARQITLAYVGGAPGVAERAAEALMARWPGVRIIARDGYFDADPASADTKAIMRWLGEHEPDVLMVGMGMPRQENWIAGVIAQLPPMAVLSVGAAFDYEAGVQKAAPRWMGRTGLEWLYRLVHDPVRLARRYMIEPWLLLPELHHALSHEAVSQRHSALRAVLAAMLWLPASAARALRPQSR